MRAIDAMDGPAEAAHTDRLSYHTAAPAGEHDWSCSLSDKAGPRTLPKSPSGNSWLLPSSMMNAVTESKARPPVVKQALVAAAARILTPDSFANPRQLIRVDGSPVIIHLLRNLQVSLKATHTRSPSLQSEPSPHASPQQASGIRRTVITLGHAAHLLAAEVRRHSFGEMVGIACSHISRSVLRRACVVPLPQAVEFVWCEQSSWKRGHASNILAARSMFDNNDPILLVMSDHIFDQRLLRRCCLAHVPPGHATVLIDDSQSMVDWAAPGGRHCQVRTLRSSSLQPCHHT